MTQKKYQDKIYILIELFIKKPYSWDDKKFKQEMVAFSKLVKSYPDFEFFYHLPEYSNKFNSFWGFQVKCIKEKTDKLYKEFIQEKSNRPQEFILEKDPVIKLDNLDKRKNNTSILEFLKE